MPYAHRVNIVDGFIMLAQWPCACSLSHVSSVSAFVNWPAVHQLPPPNLPDLQSSPCQLIAKPVAQAPHLESPWPSSRTVTAHFHPPENPLFLTSLCTPAEHHTHAPQCCFSSGFLQWPPSGISLIHPCPFVSQTTIWVTVTVLKYKSDHVFPLLKALETLFLSLRVKHQRSYNGSQP